MACRTTALLGRSPTCTSTSRPCTRIHIGEESFASVLEPTPDPGGDVCQPELTAAAGHDPDRGEEFVFEGALEQEAAGAGGQGVKDVPVVVEGGEHEHPGSVRGGDDAPESLRCRSGLACVYP